MAEGLRNQPQGSMGNLREDSFGAATASEILRFGSWNTDESGLPCFDGHFSGAPERAFLHGLSSGRISALVNRWGVVHLFTTEGGYTDLSARSPRVRSGLYLDILVGDERHPLIYGDLASRKGTRYGIGYAEFRGTWQSGRAGELEVTQEFYALPDGHTCIGGAFTLRNIGRSPIFGMLRICADVEPGRKQSSFRRVEASEGRCVWRDFHPELGDYQLCGDREFRGRADAPVSLVLERPFELEPEEACVANVRVGYGKQPLPVIPSPPTARRAWATCLAKAKFAGLENWVIEEAVWSLGQLYSFRSYDRSVSEYYFNLGGYGWAGFGVREVSETAVAVASWDPEMALACLRWTAKLQQPDGDLPHYHAFRRPGDGEKPNHGHRDSDSEIWFVLACAEVLETAGNDSVLDEQVPYWDGTSGTLLDHLRRAVFWVRDEIGTGSHGLIRIADGDWNDYLSHVGALGRGESMMNTGIACRALSRLIPLVEGRDPEFAGSCMKFLQSLRDAAEAGFDGSWFVRGYTDDGLPFGTAGEDRVFLNAQSWCVLGGCGSATMRESAMQSVWDKCRCPLGFTLMSRPYPCPPPERISTCPIPQGDGENAGIWPQTVHWAVWALADLGWKDQALDVWKRISLRNHARSFPEVPYGIFNGPDCYSSHFSGEREGWTEVEGIARSSFPPMNPAVAWQAFSLNKIMELVS